MIFLEYQNINIFLQKATFRISLKKFLWLKKLKTLCHGHMLLLILKLKKLLEHFTKKNCKKTNQNEFRIEKVIKKGDKLYVNGKAAMVLLTVGLIKKTV